MVPGRIKEMPVYAVRAATKVIGNGAGILVPLRAPGGGGGGGGDKAEEAGQYKLGGADHRLGIRSVRPALSIIKPLELPL